MDPKTRQRYARILLPKLIVTQTWVYGVVGFMFFAIFASGYNCAEEAFVVQEDPSYALGMASVNPKWRLAMEKYYNKNDIPIPWDSTFMKN